MTEKRQRIGPTPSLRPPPCEAEFPPPPHAPRTRFVTKDAVFYDVCDFTVRDSVVMAKAVHAARPAAAAAAAAAANANANTTAASNPVPADPFHDVALRDNPCVLPNVNSDAFEEILRYCYFHALRPADRPDKRAPQLRAELKQWDDNFVRSDPRRLCELASAAYYLDMRKLVDLICRAIAAIISGKTTAQIRNTFDIEDDLIQSLTGMIQFDNYPFPPAARSAAAARHRKQPRPDAWDKPGRKPPKTFSLSAVDDFATPDQEERTDAPQLGTHSVDEVEKWINGPDPAKGNGKRRKKKKKHRAPASQPDPPPEPVPTSPSSPPASPSTLTPPSPSLSSSANHSSSADPSYVATTSSLDPAPSFQVTTRAQEYEAAVQERRAGSGSDGFREPSPLRGKQGPEVITLLSDDDEVLDSGNAPLIVLDAMHTAVVESQGQDGENSKKAMANGRPEHTSKTGRAVASESKDHPNANLPEAVDRVTPPQAEDDQIAPTASREARRPSRGEKEQPVRVVESSQPLDALSNGDISPDRQLSTIVQQNAAARASEKLRRDAQPAKEKQKAEKAEKAVKMPAAKNQTANSKVAPEVKEDSSVELVRDSRSCKPSPSKKGKGKPATEEGASKEEETVPSFIRCPDHMDKEVEDFANRLNGGDSPGHFDGAWGDASDPQQRRRNTGTTGEQNQAWDPKSRQRDITTKGQQKGARSGSSANDAAGLRIMENQLKQARREAQLLERKRHFEERAKAVEQQIASLLSEREKVRDELSLVKIQLMQMERERNPRQPS